MAYQYQQPHQHQLAKETNAVRTISPPLTVIMIGNNLYTHSALLLFSPSLSTHRLTALHHKL